ncbi:acetyltransferase [Stanieria sp. NIES-3757]|nr:acetyltransferase [Stanieria sp. NIES-3757]
MTKLLSIKNPTKYEIDRIVNSIVLAFSLDPVARWMYPLPHNYLQNFPNFVKKFGGKALDTKTVYYTDDYSGAAFWLPPQTEPDSEAICAFLQATIPEQQQEEVFALLEQMGNYHPDESHWYLGILGVEPTQQKKGYGSMLIKQILQKCDRERTIAYLESSNPINISFYEKHGFEVIGKIQAGESPTIFPMLRYPR